MTVDIVIRGASIIDGTGRAAFPGDLALDGDRIVEIGTVREPARIEISVPGSVIAPGFIDAHTHDDRLVLYDRSMAPKVSQGVTTVVTGNCGISLAPLVIANGDPVPPLDIVGAREDFRFAKFSAYLAALTRTPPAVNVVALVGHTTLRAAEVKDLGRTASCDELAAMARRLSEALEAGACGFSSGVFYPPASAASAEELIPLLKQVAAVRGLYTAHIRDEGDGILEALDEALGCARAARVPIVISHLKCSSPRVWGFSSQLLDRLQEMGQRQPIHFDAYPYTASSTMIREDVVRDSRSVIISWSKPHPEAAGKPLEEIADRWECSLTDAARRVRPGGAVYFRMDETDEHNILRHPEAMIGSDGLPHDRHPHPRLWGAFPRILGHYVRDVGALRLEEAIRKMTSLPSRVFGLAERGRIAPGFFADLAIFDPKRIGDRATFEEPAQQSVGISHVFVNGSLAWHDGQATRSYAGRILQRHGNRSRPSL